MNNQNNLFSAKEVLPQDISVEFFLQSDTKIKKIFKRNGSAEEFFIKKIYCYLVGVIERNALIGVNLGLILENVFNSLYPEITSEEIFSLLQFACCHLIEQDPVYSKLSSAILIENLVKKISQKKILNYESYKIQYRNIFTTGITNAIKNNFLHQSMATYDLDDLAHYLCIERDNLFDYMGIFTLKERYLMKRDGLPVEVPQGYWMRIAMGLALNEDNKQEMAKKFYDQISQFNYMPSTPTLFHSGFPVAQLSSCYLNVSSDDLHNIFKTFSDNAQLSKWAGGIATSWTNIRGSGAYIKSIKSTSQGVIPYLKIADDVIGAITKAGIRRGGSCAYLEPWHYDFEDFLDLRRNTGDHRRRTHDMNTASWIPDLFMKRVQSNGQWTLFSSHETPDLHDLYGKKFEEKYCFYEEEAEKGNIKLFKKLSAAELWKKMVMRLFETGHPWITFKDACNIRSPQDHCGVVHSSNLCTEITLNTSETETAVCNLGSINLSNFVSDNGIILFDKLKETVKIAVTMLDNVIDLNFYPTGDAQRSNLKHRPIGLGIMGWQDMLYKLNLSFLDQEVKTIADEIIEFVSYHAIETSCEIAQKHGSYETFKGSKWDRGIFPCDTLDILEKDRQEPICISRSFKMPWNELKIKVKQHGIRNSLLMAVAPTATISTITGCFSSIAPAFSNLYAISNVTGEFTVVNKYLIQDLKKLNLWNNDIVDLIKFYNGSIQKIEQIPANIRRKYLTCFEIDQKLLLELTALRGKWIDQSQSHNVFYSGTSGKELSEIYFHAWKLGLKTTYYLRTLGASQIEKSTLNAKQFGFTQMREKVTACSLNNPEECLSCQ